MKINFWEIPLTSAVLAFLSIIVPFWSRVNVEFLSSVWSWGLIVGTNFTSFQIGFMPDMFFLFTGFLFTFLEVLAVNALSIITYRIWKNDIDVSNVQIFSFISAIILIISPIFLVSGAYMAIINWSELYIPTFGFILPFISAFFAIITVILAKIHIKKK